MLFSGQLLGTPHLMGLLISHCRREGARYWVGQFRITDPLSPKPPYLEGQAQSPSLRV